MSNETIVHILWTGGSDSTFRITELSKKEIDIQPYYVLNKGRQSTELELNAMKEIRSLLENKKSTNATILPTIFLQLEDFFPMPQDIKEAYDREYKKNNLGRQYMWLGAISRQIPNLELCLEYTPSSKPTDPPPSKFACNIQVEPTILITDDVVSYYQIDPKSNTDNFTLFGHFRFPSSTTRMTKEDMYKAMVSWGDEDVYNSTWVCTMPHNGEPCGYCGPCRTTISQGMAWRFPKNSLKRYNNRIYWRIKYKIRKTLKQLISNKRGQS